MFYSMISKRLPMKSTFLLIIENLSFNLSPFLSKNRNFTYIICKLLQSKACVSVKLRKYPGNYAASNVLYVKAALKYRWILFDTHLN